MGERYAYHQTPKNPNDISQHSNQQNDSARPQSIGIQRKNFDPKNNNFYLKIIIASPYKI